MTTVSTDLALVAAFVVVGFLAMTRRFRSGHLLAILIFSIYLVGVAHYAILPIRYDTDMSEPWIVVVGLRPFFLPGGDFMSGDQLFYNLLLGVPFGFGLPFIWRTSLHVVLLAGLAFSLSIEALQLVLNIAGLARPPWTIDVNDVIMNAVGAAVGVAALTAVRLVYPVAFGHLNLGSPWAHFHGTLLNRERPNGAS